MWSNDQIKKHKESVKKLTEIKDKCMHLIEERESINEREVQDFALEKFQELSLKTDTDPPIISFGKDTSNPHYFPSKDSEKIEKGQVVMIDLWGRLKEPQSPFADLTWMAYYGEKIPTSVKERFQTVVSARDRCLDFIERKLSQGDLPTEKKVYRTARLYLEDRGLEENLEHRMGHILGVKNVHGDGEDVEKDESKRLKVPHGYSLEPGIYFKDSFGFRTEINFYISSKRELKVSSETQESLTLI